MPDGSLQGSKNTVKTAVFLQGQRGCYFPDCFTLAVCAAIFTSRRTASYPPFTWTHRQLAALLSQGFMVIVCGGKKLLWRFLKSVLSISPLWMWSSHLITCCLLASPHRWLTVTKQCFTTKRGKITCWRLPTSCPVSLRLTWISFWSWWLFWTWWWRTYRWRL